ncbi:hypothetical protein [Mucilaginibacter arboris]|uniref:DUF1640 domain-containing protein n=1 Tax=Mucilaginibacter arboris TaxID=2682090 RepID=A0A7K1SZS9_9SPHI|nr:hypothetical protein [Mucilaginibacter arboris]MVN22815.1 hypothetical protein [Mucilaginibacter arboris]
MTASQSLRLYELTSEFITDKDKAKEYVARIEEVVDQKFKDKETVLATKSDIAILRKEIAESKLDIIKWFVATGIALTGLVAALVKLL